MSPWPGLWVSVAALEGLGCGAGMLTDQRRDGRAPELKEPRAALWYRSSSAGVVADMLRLSGLPRVDSSSTL
jgi:hypothetical protein